MNKKEWKTPEIIFLNVVNETKNGGFNGPDGTLSSNPPS